MRAAWLAVCLAIGQLNGAPVGGGDEEQGAAAALKRLSLEELSQIEVTAPSKQPQEAFRVPMAIYVITSEDIRRSGAASIPEVLRLAPGVEVARIEGSKWAVGIRGFGSRLSRSVLVLIDGRTVYTTFFAGTYWEVQDTLLEDIERIEIIRGPGGTIWGPNAVNGVINIVTKRARDTQGFFSTLQGGSAGSGIAQFRYGGRLGGGRNLAWRAYGKGFTRGAQYHTDNADYDDWRGGQGGFRMDWEAADEKTEFTLQGDLYRQEAGQRVPLVNYAAPFRRVVEQNADLSGGNLLARWSRTLAGGGDVQITGFYDRTNRYEANFGENRDTFDVDFLVRNRLGARHRISWGAGGRTSHGAAIETTTGLTFDPIARTDYLLSVFGQDEITLVENRLALTLGAKLLRTNFAAFEVEPSTRLMWTPSNRHSVWVSYTRAVRTPSRAERDFNLSGYLGNAADGTPFFARFIANGDFRTESMNGFELGYRQLLAKRLMVDIASFHNRYQDLFSQDITGGAFFEATPAPPHLLLPAQFRNNLFGNTSGVEVAPEWRPRAGWRLRGAYSYLKMDLRKKAGSTEIGTAPIVEGSSPQHQGVAQSSWDFGKRFEADLIFRYVSALPGVASQPIPSYATGDVRLGWRLSPHVELSLIGRNLLQPWHVEFANDPGPPVGVRRLAMLRLTWTSEP